MSSIQQRVRDLAEADLQTYYARAEQFEAAWQPTADFVSQIARSLPADGPVRLPLLVHMAKIDMEFRRQQGDTRRVEDYLDAFAELEADAAAIVDLALCEYNLIPDDEPRPENFAWRFSAEVQSLFQAALAELEPVGPWKDPEQYVVKEVIGRGGWGIVNKAWDKRRARDVAIKRVNLDKTSGRRTVDVRKRIQRLRAEIPNAARVEHANIVRLYDDGVSNGHPFFVMEFCPGGNLGERLAGKPLRPQAAAALVITLAKAAQWCHEIRLIHRDLKPLNVLFGQDGSPKIADFGLALSWAQGKDAGAVGKAEGTPVYMAPEQLDPSREPAPANDVYGLGTILYECITGHPPFSGASISQVLKQVQEEAPQAPRALNRSVPRELEAVCLKCLEKEPLQRYPTATELAEDLQRFLDGKPVRARPQGRQARVWWRRVKTNPVKVLAATVVILALAGYWAFSHLDAARELERANEKRTLAEKLAESEKGKAAAERGKEHVARVVAVRERAYRGDWVNALPEFDRAILDNQEDVLALRVERLVGYFALNRTTELTAELDRLEHSPLGDRADAVKLMRATWLLCDPAQQRQGRTLARKVQDSPHLTKADRFFAKGLAAEKVGAALEAFRAAVNEDQLHYLAANSYALALAAVGERDQALWRADFIRGVFPYSPTPDLVDALVAFTDGDKDKTSGSLALMAKKLPPDRQSEIAQMARFLLLLRELRQIAVNNGAGEPPGLLDAFAPSLLKQAKPDADSPLVDSGNVPIPAWGLYQRRLYDVISASVQIPTQNKWCPETQAYVDRVHALNADYADATLRVLEGDMHFFRTIDAVDNSDVEAALQQLQTANDLLYRALREPSILPGSGFHYKARGVGMIGDVVVLKLVRDPKPIHLERVRENLHTLVADGRKWPKLRQPLFGFVIQMTTAPLVPAQCADWKLNDPAGKAAFRQRMDDLAVLGRALLDDWHIDEPHNPEISRLHEVLKAWTESSGILEEKKATPTKE